MSDTKCVIEISGKDINNEFVQDVIRESDSNIRLCYQCHKCTSGCPIADFAMDDNPSMIMHSIRLGQKDRVSKSNSIWICASCKACTTRCPQGIDVAKVMEAARKIALREGVTPPDKEICTFYETMYETICTFGRMFEPWLIVMLKLKTGHLMKDMGLGLKMFLKGKLSPLPPFGGDAGELRKIIRRAEGEK